MIDARNPVGTWACWPAAVISERSTVDRVDHRRSVGHRDHLAEAAGGGRGGAGVEVLLVLLPGRAQVHVRVDESREQVLAGCIVGLRREAGTFPQKGSGGRQLGDPALADQDIVSPVDAGARFEHVGVS